MFFKTCMVHFGDKFKMQKMRHLKSSGKDQFTS